MIQRLLPWVLVLVAACGDGSGARDASSQQGDASVPLPRGQFLPGFLWGSAVAPYQTEGGLRNTDWYQWERRCTRCSGESADNGARFLDHYEADLDAAVTMGQTAIRLGIDWSRLFPSRRDFDLLHPDEQALATYHAIIDAARARRLTVMLGLMHVALPVWLHDLDRLASAPGWEDPAIVDSFARFAGWAAAEFGGDIDYWLTLDQPTIAVLGGWLAGSMPPGKSLEPATALAVSERMAWAHSRAYDAIQAADLIDVDGDGRAARVSLATQGQLFLPLAAHDDEHRRAAEIMRYLLNHAFLQAVVFGNVDRNADLDYDDPDDALDEDALKGRLDFIGLAYAGVSLVEPAPDAGSAPFAGALLSTDLGVHGLPAPQSDLGRSIYPNGLRQVLDELAIYARPIIITATGVADAGDNVRPRFILDHLYVVNQAIDEGMDIRGFFYWSLVDGFEWNAGYCARFGLLSVDFAAKGQPRAAGAAAAIYSSIIAANTVRPELFAQVPAYSATTRCPHQPY